MRFSLVVLWFLAVAIVALVVLAPATWLDHRLAAATGGKVRLNDAEGTVWRGRGALGDARGSWRIPLAWRIAPLSLMRGAIDVELASPAGSDTPSGRVLLENDGGELRGIRARAPADILRTLVPVKLPGETGGELVLEAPAIRYRSGQTDGAFDVRWERARLATNTAALDLGTVTAHVAAQGSALVGTIANAGGDARIDGDAVFSANGTTVRATIAPGPAVPPDVARLLATLGAPDANGVIRLQWGARR